jgi:hypothetical protein
MFNVQRSVLRHSDSEDDDHHHEHKAKRSNLTSKFPPIMPPRDPRLYQLANIPEPSPENTIHARDKESSNTNVESTERLEHYVNKLQSLASLPQEERTSNIESILIEMEKESVRPNEAIIYQINLLQSKEVLKPQSHHNKTTKKQSDPDFFEPLKEKPQNVKTKRHTNDTIDQIFKSRGLSRDHYKEHLKEEERKYQESLSRNT